MKRQLVSLLLFTMACESANILRKCEIFDPKIPVAISVACLRKQSMLIVDELARASVIPLFGTETVKLMKRDDLSRCCSLLLLHLVLHLAFSEDYLLNLCL